VAKPALRVLRGNSLGRFSGGLVERSGSARFGRAQQLLELEPSFLDWIQARGISRQKVELCTAGFDLLAFAGYFMSAQIVERSHIAGLQLRVHYLFHIGTEDIFAGSCFNGPHGFNSAQADRSRCSEHLSASPASALGDAFALRCRSDAASSRWLLRTHRETSAFLAGTRR